MSYTVGGMSAAFCDQEAADIPLDRVPASHRRRKHSTAAAGWCRSREHDLEAPAHNCGLPMPRNASRRPLTTHLTSPVNAAPTTDST